MGRANIILYNLLAKGKTKPMIVVMPNGNATQTVSRIQRSRIMCDRTVCTEPWRVQSCMMSVNA